MSFVSVIVVAAGKGERFKSRVPKLLAKINKKPIISRCLEALDRNPLVREIILVVNPRNSKRVIEVARHLRIKKITGIVNGGSRRQDSVANGLAAVNPRTDLVLIHDAARPLVDQKSILACIRQAEKYGAAIVGVPVKATIKTADAKGRVAATLERNRLWEIQTPQVFCKDLLLKAYKKYFRVNVTDDASLVEKMGVKVHIVHGSYANIKVTTLEDLAIAEAIVRSYKP